MRRLPPLAALRAFEAAARHLSFLEASRELHVTPTAISHQIKLLEDIVGAPLFRRRPRPLALTEAGASLYPVLRTGFDAFSAAIGQLRDSHRDRPLTVTTTTAFAGKWLMPGLAAFQDAEGGGALEIDASEGVKDLRAGEADVAIRYQRLPAKDLECHPLIRDHYVPVASPALLRRQAIIERPGDLKKMPLIHFRWKRADPHAPSWGRRVAEARRIDPSVASIDVNGGQRYSEAGMAIDAALAGQGVALASDVDVAYICSHYICCIAFSLSRVSILTGC
jgi:LysR family glycine cleavage system transcriptional activator